MPRSANQELAERLWEPAITLCYIWKITRTDGTKLTVTDNNAPVTVTFGKSPTEDTYTPALGASRTGINTTLNLDIDTMELKGLIRGAITEADLRAGRYDYAQVEVGMVDPTRPDLGAIYMRAGNFGEVVVKEGYYQVEIRSLSQYLTNTVGRVITPDCHVDLGSTPCTIDIETEQTQDGYDIKTEGIEVDASTTSDTCTSLDSVTPVAPSGYYTEGLVVWTTGQNSGIRAEVLLHTKTAGTSTWVFLTPMPFPLSTGDEFTAYIGCNKRESHCGGRFGANDGFGNIRNFRGFPHVPTFSALGGFRDRLVGGFLSDIDPFVPRVSQP